MIEYVSKRAIDTDYVALYNGTDYTFARRVSRSTIIDTKWEIEGTNWEQVDSNTLLLQPNTQPLAAIRYAIKRSLKINNNTEFTVLMFVDIDGKLYGAKSHPWGPVLSVDYVFDQVGHEMSETPLLPETRQAIIEDMKSKSVQTSVKNFIKKYLLR